MFSGCVAYSTIKDLKDLSIHRTAAFYRHAGPKGPEEVFFAGRTIAGDRPSRYGLQGRLPFTVGRGPVPRHASICAGNVGRRSVFA